MSSPVVVAEIVRSGFVEGHHYGSVVALHRDGNPEWAVGATETPVLPRSCNKPIQALAMVRLGLDLPSELLALACASHSGEDFHVAGARQILASAGLDETALQTPADYRDPGHPLQKAIADTFADLTGEPVEAVAVDGCGAPLLSTSLVGLARAFRTLAVAQEGPERLVADAIRQHPSFVSGSQRDERALLAAIPGAIGKAGAESCYAVALPDGRAFALKTDDGAARVRPVLMAEALRRSGVLEEPGVDADAVRRTGVVELLGGGAPVGEIRACF